MRKNKRVFITSIIILLTLLLIFKSNLLSITNPNTTSQSIGWTGYGNDTLNIIKSPIDRPRAIKSFLIASTCAISGNYDFCIEQTYEYGSAKAYAEIQSTNYIQSKREVTGTYFNSAYSPHQFNVGEVYIPYKFSGDKFYLYENFGTWEKLWNEAQCNENGCYNSKQVLDSQGIYTLATAGNEYKGCPAFVVWDKDEQGSDWAWATKGFGWVGGGDCLKIKSVACYYNEDCQQGEYCDNAGVGIGTWQQWSCKTKECDEGQEKCVGNNLYRCEGYKYANKGAITGKCNVECTADSACQKTIPDEVICLDNSLNLVKSSGKCVSNTCQLEKKETQIKKCSLGCLKNECLESSNTLKYTLYSLAGIILLIIGLIIYVRRR